MISGHIVLRQPPVLLSFPWLVAILSRVKTHSLQEEDFQLTPGEALSACQVSFITLPALRGGGDLPLVIQEQQEGKWSHEIALQHCLRCLQTCTCIFCFIDNVVSHTLGMREPQVKAEAFPTKVKGARLLDRQNPSKLFHCFQSK